MSHRQDAVAASAEGGCPREMGESATGVEDLSGATTYTRWTDAGDQTRTQRFMLPADASRPASVRDGKATGAHRLLRCMSPHLAPLPRGGRPLSATAIGGRPAAAGDDRHNERSLHLLWL